MPLPSSKSREVQPRSDTSRPNRLLISSAAITENARRVQRIVGDDVRLFAALKANAYGHGLLLVARAARDGGAAGFGVSDLESALALRADGIPEPIIVYPGVVWDRDRLTQASEFALAITVTDAEIAEKIGTAATSTVDVFLEVDVGHERLGTEPEEIERFVSGVRSQPNLRVRGALCHLFEPPEPSMAVMQWQLDRMAAALDALEDLGALPEYRIAASTAPLVFHDSLRFDRRLNAVDPGRLLLGLLSRAAADRVPAQPAFLGLYSELTQVKEDAQAGRVSPYPIKHGLRIGVFPFGRGDGLADANAGHVLIRGQRAPIIGQWVDHATADVSDIAGAQAGDEVVIIGEQGEARITLADVVARRTELKLVDVAMGVGPQVPRIAVERD